MRAAAGACGLALLLGCGTPAPPRHPGTLDLGVVQFLADPLAGDPLTRSPALVRAARRLHSDLVGGAAALGIEEEARLLAGREPGAHPLLVVAGQAGLVGGRLTEARDALRLVVSELPSHAAAQLALGRVEELRGDLVAAAEAYRAATDLPVAVARAAQLKGPASTALRSQVATALSRGHRGEAEQAMLRLERLAPDDRATWESAAEARRALGDRPGELAALRWLAPSPDGDRVWVERRARAEAESGDRSVAVALLEALVRRFPAEEALAAELGRAKARWRLDLLPPHVVAATARPELDRADLAVLLYWLMPEIRAARAGAAAIATDVHDHAHRMEILRVVNLGLLGIDPSLHVFAPHRPARREEALQALIGALRMRRPPPRCVLGAEGPPPRSSVCAAAVACGLLREEADCLPTIAVSGADVLAWAGGANTPAPGWPP
jgi:tetratricopeptide (TPR) repeat protein